MFSQKYIPQSLDALSYHPDITDKLKRITQHGFLVNMIFYGPPSAGKKTRILALLAELYGPGVFQPKIETTIINKNIEIGYKMTNYYLEICPSNYGNNDKIIIGNFIKEIASTLNVMNGCHKIFIIHNVDKLSKMAQVKLKNVITMTYKTARYILICRNYSLVSDAIKSNCISMRIPLPDKNDVLKILREICKKESIRTCTRTLNTIIDTSRKLNGLINLQYAINGVQLSYISGKYAKYDIKYLSKIDKLVDIIGQDFTKDSLVRTREIIYDLYTSNINIINVILYLVNATVKHFSDDVKAKIIEEAAKCEHKMHLGNKEPIYLESFVIFLMDMYQNKQVCKKVRIKIKKVV